MLSSLKTVLWISILIFHCVHLCQTRQFRHKCFVRENVQWKEKELKMVHLLFRHGARTPLFLYPKDPYINETFYPFGLGQLTNKGKRDMYKTGHWLKKRYGEFLGKHYEPNLVWGQSSGIPRTMMSLQSVLAGIFPPKHTPMDWDKHLNWQPIPTYAQPPYNDTLLLVYPCPRYSELLQKYFNLPKYQKIIKANKQVLKQLTQYTGMNITDPFMIISIYGILTAELAFGLKLPKWTRQYYPDRLLSLALEGYEAEVHYEEQRLIKGGPFVKTLIEDWIQKRNGTIIPKDRKIFVYCGHDSSILGVLAALNIWKKQFPAYGIMVIFELLKDAQTGEYGVEIYLKKDNESGAKPLTLPGCDHFCPLDKVVQLTRNIIPQNVYSICQAKNDVKITDTNIDMLNESMRNMSQFFPNNQ